MKKLTLLALSAVICTSTLSARTLNSSEQSALSKWALTLTTNDMITTNLKSLLNDSKERTFLAGIVSKYYPKYVKAAAAKVDQSSLDNWASQRITGVWNKMTGVKVSTDLSTYKNGTKAVTIEEAEIPAPVTSTEEEVDLPPAPSVEVGGQVVLFAGFGTIEAQTPAEGDSAAQLKTKWDNRDKDAYRANKLNSAEAVKKAVNTLALLKGAMTQNNDGSLDGSLVGINGALNGLAKSNLLTVAEKAVVSNA